jgi:hypothetical protein
LRSAESISCASQRLRGPLLAARKDQTVDARLGNNHPCRAANNTLISPEGAPLVFIEPRYRRGLHGHVHPRYGSPTIAFKCAMVNWRFAFPCDIPLMCSWQ